MGLSKISNSLTPPSLNPSQKREESGAGLEKRINVNEVLSQSKPCKPPRSFVAKWLWVFKIIITHLFFKVFPCCKKEKPYEPPILNISGPLLTIKSTKSQESISQDEDERIQKKDHNGGDENFEYKVYPEKLYQFKSEDIEGQIINEHARREAREFLKGIGLEIDLSPVIGGASTTGTTLLPKQFAKDLHRMESIYLSGKRAFHIKQNSIDYVEAFCKDLFDLMGEKSSRAISRLINQAAVAYPLGSYLKIKNTDADKAFTPFLDRVQINIDLQDDLVILQYKTSYECRPLSDPENPPIGFIGMETRFEVPLKELEELGALSVEELALLDINKDIAPSLEAIHTFTKIFPTSEESNAAIGIITEREKTQSVFRRFLKLLGFFN